MEQVPGFHISNVDQDERIPNTSKRNPTELATFFVDEVICYKNERDPYPLTWATGTGNNSATSAIRIRLVKMSNAFWTFFASNGRKKMYEYNRRNKCDIRLMRYKTLSLSDLDNLSLYLRKKLRDFISSKGLPHVKISVKQGYVTIANNKKFCATELAVRLGLNYSDWQGSPIMELMSNSEKKLFKEGKLAWSSLDLESLLSPVASSAAPVHGKEDVATANKEGTKDYQNL
ncbi:hypothetical protein ANCCAN_03924 [Ancylostoma caninum]|uniref:Uncharacterized protein n=1 Tax=Ancylostoma caninum TaxID=29170 RepID=A0A368H2P8_ANCCA|nr:hypothetical protein ANCCAN_03924 [Ancylostoma caninum]